MLRSACVMVMVVALAHPRSMLAAGNSAHPFPRIANIFQKWHLSDEEARDLARWDVIILDMEVAENSPAAFDLLRAFNPDATILAYITSQEVRRDIAVHPQAPLRRHLAARVHDAWYLRTPTGERTHWWPQTWLLNITAQAPAVDGERWPQAFAAFIAERIASDARWDGVFLDNLWSGISWLPQAIDLDGDGRMEDPATRDAWWRDGVRTVLAEVRHRTPDSFLITGNGGVSYAAETNGIFLEHFPNTSEGSWSPTMVSYQSILNRALAPALAILNANTGNTGHWMDWQRVRFGLTSTLLGDGYFSFDFGDQEHAQRWWYDEYGVALGLPKGVPRIHDTPITAAADTRFPKAVYRREFQHGLILVNATDAERTVTFDEEFEHIRGIQDTAVNDGTIVSEIALAAQDGRVLLRPVATLRNEPFANGAFARLFRADGSVARNGFFAYDGAFRGSTTVAYQDVNLDGRDEIIVADRGRVQVVRDGVVVQSFTPFGDAFRGAIDLAIGDLDRNGTWEVVIVSKDRGGQLGIFNLLEGRLLTPLIFPFGYRYEQGLSVAIRQPGRGSRPHILVGGGRGGRPEVRTLNWDGSRREGVQVVFDARFRGGTRVAAGDLDGDGIDEVVVGAGPGGGPHVRVFRIDERDAWELSDQFFAFDAMRRGGVDVAVSDVDGDGRAEIVCMSTYAFTLAGR